MGIVVALLQRNPGLEEVRVDAIGVSGDYSPLSDTLTQLPKLQDLSTELSIGARSVRYLYHLMNECRSLRKLSFGVKHRSLPFPEVDEGDIESMPLVVGPTKI